MEAVFRRVYGRNEGDFYQSEMEAIESFSFRRNSNSGDEYLVEIDDKSVQVYFDVVNEETFEDLRNCINLTYVRIEGLAPMNELENIDFLTDMTKLETLSLNGTPTKDLSALGGLRNLREFSSMSSQRKDISVLEGLEKLQIVNLMGNQIEDITALATLVQLEELNLAINNITDYSPIYGLENLQALSVNCSQEDMKEIKSNLPFCKIN